jgi:hypothetical protein
MASNNPSSFEDDHFEFPEPIPVSSASPFTTTLELVKSVALSRPFLLALIVFLSYRLWMGSSRPSNNSSNPLESRKLSHVSERLSVKKSQRVPIPMGVPSVTAAKRN